jgi:hypothetical protein
MTPMVLGMEPARQTFEQERKIRQKAVRLAVQDLHGWQPFSTVKGFSPWGLGTIIGEAGDIGNYPGCRHLFKRLGLAPDDCYSRGEKSTGRMIPRSTRGRIMGIIADPLLRAQWRGETDDESAHPIGPYGKVYGDTKARRLAEEKSKGHADKLARRTMVKALLHDVHRAWHGLPLDYVLGDGASQMEAESLQRRDRTVSTFPAEVNHGQTT